MTQMANPLISNQLTLRNSCFVNLIFTVVPPTLMLHDYGWDMCYSLDVFETDQVDQQLH